MYKYSDTMSRNAIEAYENGEAPKSAWSKNMMLAAINAIIDMENLPLNRDVFTRMKRDSLLRLFFIKSSAHHTGTNYIMTDFYTVDADFLRVLNNEKLYALYTEQRKRKDSSIHNGRRFVEVAFPEAKYNGWYECRKRTIRKGYIKGDYFTGLDGRRKNIHSDGFEVLKDITATNLYDDLDDVI